MKNNSLILVLLVVVVLGVGIYFLVTKTSGKKNQTTGGTGSTGGGRVGSTGGSGGSIFDALGGQLSGIGGGNKTHIIEPTSLPDRAPVYSNENYDKILGYLPKGTKVQVLSQTSDGCLYLIKKISPLKSDGYVLMEDIKPL